MHLNIYHRLLFFTHSFYLFSFSFPFSSDYYAMQNNKKYICLLRTVHNARACALLYEKEERKKLKESHGVRFSYTDFVHKEYFQSSWWTNKLYLNSIRKFKTSECILHTFFSPSLPQTFYGWQISVSVNGHPDEQIQDMNHIIYISSIIIY